MKISVTFTDCTLADLNELRKAAACVVNRSGFAPPAPEPEPETPEPEQQEPAEEPKKTRRRRGVRTGEATTDTATDSGNGRRRRRGKAAPAEEAPAEEVSDEISDADVSRAASQAAEVITPQEVTAVLESFGVASVGELDQAQRREFLDTLNERMS